MVAAGGGGGPVGGPDEFGGYEGEAGVFEDETGFAAFDEAEVGVYDGPDEDGRGGDGPVEGNGAVEPEAVVVQKSRRDWLTVAGVELWQGPCCGGWGPGASSDAVMDRDAVENYIAGLGRGGPAADVGNGANGTREVSGASDAEENGRGKGHAWTEAVPDAGVEAGVLEATRDGDEPVGEGVVRVAGDACAPAGAEEAGAENRVVDGQRGVSEMVEETVSGPAVIPQVVDELDGDAVAGDGPKLSDMLHDIGEKSVKETGPYGTKPAKKYFRQRDSGAGNG